MFRVLNRQSELISLLFELPVGVSVATSPDCKEILHNAPAAKFLRIAEGDSFSFFAEPPPNVKAYDEFGRELRAEELTLHKAITERRENKQVVELEWPDGVRKTAVYNSKPIYDHDGRLVGGIAISEDITDYALLERRFQQEKEWLRIELERLDRMEHVSQLAAGVSHEVRNPLTTVKGFLQLMRSKRKYEDDAAMIDMMLEELNRANEIISDFLMLTRTHEKQLKRGNLADVIERLFPLLENDAFLAKKKLEFKLTPISDSMLDAVEIKQLMLNLVRNAIEASPVGGLVVIETFEDAHSVGFIVADEGDGIPQQVMEHLGKAFVTTKPNGTGVGLTICYDIARHHRAEIDVRSSSSGTVFRVQFPKLAEEADQSAWPLEDGV